MKEHRFKFRVWLRLRFSTCVEHVSTHTPTVFQETTRTDACHASGSTHFTVACNVSARWERSTGLFLFLPVILEIFKWGQLSNHLHVLQHLHTRKPQHFLTGGETNLRFIHFLLRLLNNRWRPLRCDIIECLRPSFSFAAAGCSFCLGKVSPISFLWAGMKIPRLACD